MNGIHPSDSSHQNKHIAIWISLFTVMFFIINLTGDHIFNKTNTLKMVLLAVAVTLFFAFHLVISNSSLTHKPKILLLLAMPLLATLPGLLFSAGEYSYSTPYELSSQLLCIIWAYLIFYYLSNTNKTRHLQIFIACLVPTILFVCFIALAEKAGLNPALRFHLNPFESTWVAPPKFIGTVERVESTFGNINYFASFLIQLIPLILFLTFTHWQKRRDPSNKNWNLKLIILLVTLFVMTLSLQYTETRAAIAASLISIGLYFSLYFLIFKRTAVPVGVLAILPFLFIFLLTDQSLISRFSSLSNILAWQSRIEPWIAALNSISEAPLFGYGPGSSYQLFFQFSDPDSRLLVAEHSYNHVHNELLEVLQEGGLFGLFFYLVFWIIIFYSAWKITIKNDLGPEVRLLALSILCALAAYHLHGLFSVAPRMVVARMIAYALAALTLTLAWQHLHLPAFFRTTQHRSVSTIITLASSLAIIWLWLIPYSTVQHNYAKALSSENGTTTLFSLVEKVEDIYVLDEAAKRALELDEREILKKVSEKIDMVFPGYRKAQFYRAYSQYLDGDLQKALNTASTAQKNDIYLMETNSLLIKISYDLDNKDIFKQQIALAIKKFGCKYNIIECKKTNVEVLMGQMADPIQFRFRDQTLQVYLDTAFYNLLRQTYLDSGTQYTSPEKNIMRLIKKLGTSEYFRPKSTEKDAPLSTEDISDLNQYLQLEQHIQNQEQEFLQQLSASESLRTQIRQYHKAKDNLDKDLKKKREQLGILHARLTHNMDLASFIASKKFLVDFSTFLSESLTKKVGKTSSQT